MIKDRTTIFFLINFFLLLSLAIYIITSPASQTVVYANTPVLFEKFKMTIEMQQVGKNEFKKRQQEIDSINNLIGLAGQRESNINLILLANSKKDSLIKYQQNFEIRESDKIWKRLNSYIDDYSKSRDYSIILGQKSDIDILYGVADYDITSDLLLYVNRKYEGSE